MPGVYAQRLYARTHTSGQTKSVQDAPTTNDHDCTDAEPTKHTQPFTGERGLGIGIINQKFISKKDFFYKLYIQGCGFYITDNYNKNKVGYAENLLKFTVGYAILLHTAYISFMRISICGEGRYEIQRTYIAA